MIIVSESAVMHKQVSYCPACQVVRFGYLSFEAMRKGDCQLVGDTVYFPVVCDSCAKAEAEYIKTMETQKTAAQKEGE